MSSNPPTGTAELPIPDDWSNISDDEYSVISLPSVDGAETLPVASGSDSETVNHPMTDTSGQAELVAGQVNEAAPALPAPIDEPQPTASRDVDNNMAEPQPQEASLPIPIHPPPPRTPIQTGPYEHPLVRLMADPCNASSWTQYSGQEPLPFSPDITGPPPVAPALRPRTQQRPPLTADNLTRFNHQHDAVHSLNLHHPMPPPPPPPPAVDLSQVNDSLTRHTELWGSGSGRDSGADDSNNSPVILDALLKSVLEVIARTQHVVTSRVRRHNEALAERISVLSNLLYRDLDGLIPIVSQYAQHFQRRAARPTIYVDGDIPLDPSLHQWVAGLREQLEMIQDEVGRVMDPARRTRPRLMDWTVLTGLAKSVAAYEDQLQDFMPIIQADFDEFRTKHMDFDLPDSPGKTAAQRSNYRLTETLPAIRTALYFLKDQIHFAVDNLDQARALLPDSGSALALDVKRALLAVSSAVSRALTNNSSEWLEADLMGQVSGGGGESSSSSSSPNRGLSYVDFCELDAATIHDIGLQLKQIGEDISPPRAAAGCRGSGLDDEAHDIRIVRRLMDDQQLDTLEALAMVLREILTPE